MPKDAKTIPKGHYVYEFKNSSSNNIKQLNTPALLFHEGNTSKKSIQNVQGFQCKENMFEAL